MSRVPVLWWFRWFPIISLHGSWRNNNNHNNNVFSFFINDHQSYCTINRALDSNSQINQLKSHRRYNYDGVIASPLIVGWNWCTTRSTVLCLHGQAITINHFVYLGGILHVLYPLSWSKWRRGDQIYGPVFTQTSYYESFGHLLPTCNFFINVLINRLTLNIINYHYLNIICQSELVRWKDFLKFNVMFYGQ